MIKQTDKKHKSILNFLYTHQTKDMEKIYFQIKKNEIECDIEEYNKCLIIKNLFLQKIDDGMNYEDYYNYKESIKRLDANNHHLYLDSLISILGLSDNDLLKIVYKEVLNDNFECLKTSIRNKEIIFTPSLVIDMLNEIQRNSRLVVGRYVSSITKDKSKDEIIDIYDDIKNCNIVYIEIIKNIYTEKYGYLKDGIFNEVYLNCLNDLENIFMTYFRTLIGSLKKDIVGYNIFPCNVEVRHGHDGYGYYKKYKR